MLKAWEALPPIILTSSTTKQGREDILKVIDETNKDFVFKH